MYQGSCHQWTCGVTVETGPAHWDWEVATERGVGGWGALIVFVVPADVFVFPWEARECRPTRAVIGKMWRVAASGTEATKKGEMGWLRDSILIWCWDSWFFNYFMFWWSTFKPLSCIIHSPAWSQTFMQESRLTQRLSLEFLLYKK